MGNILDGCTVRCSSSLTVKGTINAANIYCIGNLNAVNGIVSSKNNTIDVRGKIQTKFVKNASIECCKGVTVAEDAVNSDIVSRERISVCGKVSGCNLSAVSGVTAETVDSSDAAHGSATISVGIHYKLIQLLDDMSNEILGITKKCDLLREQIKIYETKERIGLD